MNATKGNAEPGYAPNSAIECEWSLGDLLLSSLCSEAIPPALFRPEPEASHISIISAKPANVKREFPMHKIGTGRAGLEPDTRACARYSAFVRRLSLLANPLPASWCGALSRTSDHKDANLGLCPTELRGHHKHHNTQDRVR